MPTAKKSVNKSLGNGNTAPLRNIGILDAQMRRLIDRPPHLPGIGSFTGPSGFGKSTAAAYVAAKYQAFYVEIRSSWTGKAFLESLLRQMGVVPKRTAYQMTDQAAYELAASRSPLILDEFDNAVSRNLVELVRDLYEQSQSPIILIGEENLPQKLQEWERFHGRIMDWSQAVAANIEDAHVLAKHYTPGITIADDLMETVLAAAHGSVRRIVTNLERIRQFAEAEGLAKIDKAAWGDRPLFTAKAPAPRRF